MIRSGRTHRLIVTIDTEQDKGPKWRSPPVISFRSVMEAIPRRLAPLFREFGIRPTYFLSPEVLSNAGCLDLLRGMHDCELAPHLHVEFVAPGLRDPSVSTVLMQRELASALEREKLETLTELYCQQIGSPPTSFRAGRFGISRSTGRFLRELGYRVDSSVTPHLCWSTSRGRRAPDFRRLPESPYFVSEEGDIWRRGSSDFLEVPLTLLAAGTIDSADPGVPVWFRPWYATDRVLRDIVRFVANSQADGPPRPLVMMLHSVELVPGASPYPQTESDVTRFLSSLRGAFQAAAELGIESRTLREYYEERRTDHRTAIDLRTSRSGARTVARGPRLSRVSRGIAFAGRWPHSLRQRVRKRVLGKELDVRLKDVWDILVRHDAQRWFAYAFRTWEERPEPRETCHWLRDRLPTEAKILEAGCGMATNLIWFSQHGFRNLYGFDIDERTIAAAKEICEKVGAPVRLWRDDGQRPSLLHSGPYDAIVLLNWLYSVEDLDLVDLLRRYRERLASKGFLAAEIIDTSYDEVPNNQYLSSDWNKPEGLRGLTEYKRRHSRDEVCRAASAAGLTIIHTIVHPLVIPRPVYVLSPLEAGPPPARGGRSSSR